MKPRVLISLLNWNTYANTIRCIQQLADIDYENYSIVVIDNCSANDSVQQIRSAHPAVKIVCSRRNNGYASGHRLAAEQALRNGYDLIWLLNTDLHLRKDALSALVAAYQRHSAAIFGSLVLRCESPDTVAFAGGLEIEDGVVDVTSVYNRYKGLDLATVRHLVRERQVSDLHGCSWLIPLDVIRKYGFMDESYFLYAEETAYSYYLRTKGIPSIIVPESVVVHDASASFAGCSDMENIQRYYRHRNWERLRRQYLNVSRRTIIREHGGKQHLFKFFVSYCLSSGARRKQLAAKFYTYLAAIHAVLGVKGKTFRPEDYFTAPR